MDLLKKYYELEIQPDVVDPFESLSDDQKEYIRRSWGFSCFRLAYAVADFKQAILKVITRTGT